MKFILIILVLGTLTCSEDKQRYSTIFKNKLNTNLKAEGFSGGYVLLKKGEVLLEEKKYFNRKIYLKNLRHYFLSVGILRLVDQGKIELDDRLGEYISEFDNSSLLVESILNHSSGLGTRLEPGGYWIWSEANLFWAEKLIEEVSGKSLDNFFAEEFFSKYEMNSSNFNKNNSIVTTINDLIRWEQNWSKNKILPSSLRKKLIEPTEIKDSFASNKFNYGYGMYSDGNNHWQFSTNSSYSILYYRVQEEEMGILIVHPGNVKKGDLISWKSIITENIYNTKKITFKKGLNPKKYIYIEDSLKDKNVPAVGLALVRDFEIVWAKNYGLLENGKLTEVNSSTQFRAGSLTKPITALGYMLFQEEYGIDDSYRLNSIATRAKVDLSFWKKRTNLTPDKILSHSSGITERDGWSLDKNQKSRRLSNLNQGKGPGLYAYYYPGKKSRYSGGAYSILQEHIQVVSKKQFPIYISEKIFQPIGMKQTSFDQESMKLSTNRVSGHDTSGKPLPIRKYSYPELGAGGLWTTPRDIALFFLAIQKSLAMRDDSVIPHHLTLKMVTPVIPASNLSVQSWIGNGLFLNGSGRGWYFYHGGHSEGHKSIAIFHKTKGYGIVIMTNSENGSSLIWSILRSMSLSQRWDKFIN